MGLGQLIHVKYLERFIGIDENIKQQISGSERSFIFVPLVGNNIAVPADQKVVPGIKSADFYAFVQVIAGIAVVQDLFGF